MSKPTKSKYTTDQFITAIKGSGGIVSTIAARVGCDWNTAKAYMDKFPTVRRAYEDECELVNDVAESTIIKAIREGDVATAKWWITKKRRETFADRIEHTGAGGDVIRVTLNNDND